LYAITYNDLVGIGMIVNTSADLGAAIRARRRQLKLGQGDLAGKVGVQRQWVVKIESGKSTAEVGLVLRALAALGLELEVKGGDERPTPSATSKPPKGISYDIEAALERTRPSRKNVLAAFGRETFLTPPRQGGTRGAAAARKKR